MSTATYDELPLVLDQIEPEPASTPVVPGEEQLAENLARGLFRHVGEFGEPGG